MMFRTLCLLLLTAGLADGAEEKAAPPEDVALTAELGAVDARAAKIKDFTAEFRQEKFTALLKKPLVSVGSVRVAGPIIRWDTREPEPTVLYSDGREIRIYYPTQKLQEIYTIDQRLGDLATSPLPRLATLREHFVMERSGGESFNPPKDRKTLLLKLTPIDKTLQEHVDRVNVLLDIEAAHILELEMIDADGDRTHVAFSKFRLDSNIRPADLELTVPADTAVSRPLDAK